MSELPVGCVIPKYDAGCGIVNDPRDTVATWAVYVMALPKAPGIVNVTTPGESPGATDEPSAEPEIWRVRPTLSAVLVEVFPFLSSSISPGRNVFPSG
jgi:hypothetical protein